MKPIHSCKSSRRYAILVMVLAVVCSLTAGRAVPQEETKESPKGSRPATEMQVIQAKFVKARELGLVISQILTGHPVRVSFDERSNSIIVVATPDDMATVKEIIKKIDVPRSTREPAVRFLPLKYTKADVGLNDALARFLPGGNFVVDRDRNLVIVSGDEKTVETAESLINRIDQPPDRTTLSDREMQVRVLWLGSGFTPK